jgi:hypothetical protein
LPLITPCWSLNADACRNKARCDCKYLVAVKCYFTALYKKFGYQINKIYKNYNSVREKFFASKIENFHLDFTPWILLTIEQEIFRKKLTSTYIYFYRLQFGNIKGSVYRGIMFKFLTFELSYRNSCRCHSVALGRARVSHASKSNGISSSRSSHVIEIIIFFFVQRCVLDGKSGFHLAVNERKENPLPLQ